MANLAPRQPLYEVDPLRSTEMSGEPIRDRLAAEPPLRAYASHNFNAAWFEGQDIAAFAVATVMTLGPLTAYATGFGA